MSLFLFINEFFNRNIKSLRIVGLGVVILHLFLIFIYVSPKEWFGDRLYYKAHLYASPLFYQGWVVFAPVPRESDRILVRYFHDGTWSEEEYLHEMLVGGNHFATQRMVEKSAYYLGVQIRQYTKLDENGEKDYSVPMSSFYYSKAAFLCLKNIGLVKGIKPDSLEISVERTLFPKYQTDSVKIVIDRLGVEVTPYAKKSGS